MTNATEIHSLVKYLLDNELTAEELFLLYSIYIRRESAQDQRLQSLLGKYYKGRSYYDPNGHPYDISWSTIVQKLERDGYIITYPGHATPTKDGGFHMDLSKLDVTDKFKATIISDDRDKLWDYYVAEVYGPVVRFKDGGAIPAALPDRGETEEQLKTLFWNICGNGLTERFRELCTNTQNYFEYMDRNMKITTFLKAYEPNMKALQHAMQERGGYNYNQGY